MGLLDKVLKVCGVGSKKKAKRFKSSDFTKKQNYKGDLQVYHQPSDNWYTWYLIFDDIDGEVDLDTLPRMDVKTSVVEDYLLSVGHSNSHYVDGSSFDEVSYSSTKSYSESSSSFSDSYSSSSSSDSSSYSGDSSSSSYSSDSGSSSSF